MFAPVPVTTTMFALPTALIVILPFAAAILTLLLPLLMLLDAPLATVDQVSTPEPFVDRY